MKYVVDHGGTYNLAHIFSSLAHTGSISVHITTKEPVFLQYDYAQYNNPVHITNIIINAHDNAQVDYCELFEGKELNATIIIFAFKNAQVHYQLYSSGENTSKTIIARCQDSHAEIHISGVYITSDIQNCSIMTKQHHAVAHTTSSVLIQGVALGNSRAHYEGDIFIEKNAHGSIVHQKNKNISLGNQAHIYARPVLRVQNKNVSCSHASATGQLSQEQIMFARARGFTKEHACKMILRGFLCSTVSDAILQEKIIQRLQVV